MDIEAGPAVIPLVPGGLTWQVIPAAPDGPHGRLYPNAEPVAEIAFPPTAADPQDRWIPVSMLVAQLLTVLSDQTTIEEPSVEPVR